MDKLLSKKTSLLIVLVIGFYQEVFAQESKQKGLTENLLSIKPNRCIALREGQKCFQSIKIDWQTNEKGSYCLFDSSKEEGIRCWENSSQGSLKLEFTGDESIRLLLKDDNSNLVASAELEVSWVYKKQVERSTTWRLF